MAITKIDLSKQAKNSGDITLSNSARIIGVAAGTGSTDVVIKSQLDSVSAGLDPKESVRVATTVSLDDVGNGSWTIGGSGVGKTLTAGSAGLTTIDGTQLSDGDRVLVKNESLAPTGSNLSPSDNGIYDVSDAGAGTATVFTRATDFDGSPANEVSGGAFTFVETGTTNESTGWTVENDGNVTVDTDNIVFVQFSGAGSITAGNGLTKTGNTLNIGTDANVNANSTLITTADSIEVDIGTSNGTSLAASATGLELASQITGTRDFSPGNAIFEVHTGSGALELNSDGSDSGAITIGNATSGAIVISTGSTTTLTGSARTARLSTQPANNTVPLAIATTQFVVDEIASSGDSTRITDGDATTEETYIDTNEVANQLTMVAGLASGVATATAISMSVQDNTSAGVGGAITIDSGNANGNGNNGGAITITTGNGGGGSGAGEGGDINLLSGTGAGSSGSGGAINLTAGAGGGSTGTGGEIAITAGTGGGSTGTGGAIGLTAGTGGSTNAGGGNINLDGGQGNGTGTGGDIAIIGGTAGTSNAESGNVFIRSGAASAGGTAGDVIITTDATPSTNGGILIATDSAASSTTADTIILDTVARGARLATQPADNTVPLAVATTQYVVDTVAASGDTTKITDGDAGADETYIDTDEVANQITMQAGLASGVAAATAVSIQVETNTSAGVGGAIDIDAGTGFGTGNGGAITINAGMGGATNGAGGAITIAAGESDGTGVGGALSLTSGQNDAGGAGGNTGTVALNSGDQQGSSGDTGTVTVRTGTVAGAGTSGNLVLQSGNASAGANTGNVDIEVGSGGATPGNLRIGDSNATTTILIGNTTNAGAMTLATSSTFDIDSEGIITIETLGESGSTQSSSVITIQTGDATGSNSGAGDINILGGDGGSGSGGLNPGSINITAGLIMGVELQQMEAM